MDLELLHEDTSVDEIISEVEFADGSEYHDFSGFRGVPLETLERAAPIIAHRFLSLFKRTLTYGIQAGEKLRSGNYDQFELADGLHERAKGKAQVHSNALHVIREIGVNISALGKTEMGMNLLRKYLHDYGDSSIRAFLILRYKPKEIGNLEVIGRHFEYNGKHILAEMEGGYDFEKFDLGMICSDASVMAEMKDPGKYSCKFQGGSLQINGNKDSIYAAINNICKNGVDTVNHSVSVELMQENNFAIIIITDRGNGVPLEFRGSIMREGVSFKGSSGLGLSIASRAIKDIHGGRIEIGFGKRMPFTGAEFKIYLPLNRVFLGEA